MNSKYKTSIRKFHRQTILLMIGIFHLFMYIHILHLNNDSKKCSEESARNIYSSVRLYVSRTFCLSNAVFRVKAYLVSSNSEAITIDPHAYVDKVRINECGKRK